MAASISDKLTASESGGNPAPTTVSSARSIGGATLACVALTNWPTVSPVHFITYKKKTDGTMDRTTLCLWKGIKSGTSIGSLTLKGGTDAGNAVGDFVEMAPTSTMWQDLYDGLTTTLNADGTLKAGIVTGAKIASTTVTASNIDFTTFPAWTTYTATLTGWSGTPTQSCRYTKIGTTVHVQISVMGTSNATTATISLPFSSSPSNFTEMLVHTADAADRIARVNIGSSATSVSVPAGFTTGASPSGNMFSAWATTGPKNIFFACTYEAA